jgi:thiamine-phosphate pyrophosphorylase
MSWERILDVNLNRLTESLKFLEDVIRFSASNQTLLPEIRRLRRDFLAAKKKIPLVKIIAFRQSRRDPGRPAGFDSRDRKSFPDLVLAGCARAKESSRTLEEILKISDPAAANRVKELRFKIYDLEKSLLEPLGRRFDPRLQAVLDEKYLPRLNLTRTIPILIYHGATMIQLRVKTWPDRKFYRLARTLRGLITDPKVTFIINNRPDIARVVNADGVHLGADDLPVRTVRKFLGSSFVIGASAVNLTQAARAQAEGADYLGVGAVFATGTKPEARPCGLAVLKRICGHSRIPVIAIGGITAANRRAVRKTGAAGIAVCAALFEGDLKNNLRSLTGK